ncbi:MAG: hypothetical protein H6818_02960 [Phycisphaerales bacterium]|nr:hypothetical protein [Phycisphaerales bacterium]MCB9864659.1 hypothetical protein [Phycisphaerales bacterium]
MALKWAEFLNRDLLRGIHRRRLRRFPELAYSETTSDRSVAYRQAKHAILGTPKYERARMVIGLGVVFLIVISKAAGMSEWIPILIPILCLVGFLLARRQQPLIRAELQRIIFRLKYHCATCDYSLHGNTSGRCPECGAEIPPDQAKLISSKGAIAPADVLK